MPSLEIAHIREQGQDMVIAPLDDSFHHKTSGQQQDTVAQIQVASSSAGLRGTVVVVWENPSGGMNFIAPRQWHPFFRSISLGWVARNVNKTLSW